MEETKIKHWEGLTGWIQKRTCGVVKRWQSKWGLLKGKVFQYFNTENLKQPAGVFNFAQVVASVKRKTEKEFELRVEGCRRVFLFRTVSSETTEMWVKAIGLEMDLEVPNTLGSQKDFWKFPQISQTDFAAIVQTGDILLFRSKSIFAKAQRAITRNQYDHVALLLKLPPNLAFLEATKESGVSLVLWEEFLEKNWHLLYSRLIYRKLKSPDIEPDLISFICRSRGKKFNNSLKKILTKGKTNEEIGYFCSELVASAFIEAKILPEDIPASSYWPGNFSEERPSYLINASLGPLIQINFNI